MTTETPDFDASSAEMDDDDASMARQAGMPGGHDANDPRFDAPVQDDEPSAQRLDLLDVPLHVTVELGRTKMPIGDVLNLASGAVIELEKMAGEPLDVLLNGRLVARGEAVVVGERFGIRITTIVSPRERLAKLN